MIAGLAIGLLGLVPPATGEVVHSEPARPSRLSTHLAVECGGRSISIRWTARYPGRHAIEEVTVDNMPLAADQYPILASFVADMEIDTVTVLRCGERDSAFHVDLLVGFGIRSVPMAELPRYRGLRVSNGRVTVLR